MKSMHGVLMLTILLAVIVAVPIQAAEITNFTGADPDEGVDFDGDFVYAVNIFGPGGQTIRDATFTEDEETDGFFIESTHQIIDWALPDYGGSDDDEDLAEIMQSIRWTNVPTDLETVNIEMDVTAGEDYKLQMFFTESCCNRGFNITLEEDLLVEDFAIHEHHLDDIWNINSREDGVLITHEFTAADPLVELALGLSETGDYPDNNGHISAITLERLTGGLVGDYNENGEIDAGDLDVHAQYVKDNNLAGDLNMDGVTNNVDRLDWIKTIQKSWVGDADFDGEFNSADFVKVFTAGLYETGQMAGYGEGDWDGDMVFDSADFVAAFTDGGYEQGVLPATAAVPEPASVTLMALGVLAIFGYGRRRG